MNTITDIQKKILNELRDLQCFEEDGGVFNFNDDETPLMSYKKLEEKIGLSRARLQVEVRELRDIGFVELAQAVDSDYIPSGSGWMLTKNGVAFINNKNI